MAKPRKTKTQRAPRSTSTATKRRGSPWFIGAALSVTILVWAGFQLAKNRASHSTAKDNSEGGSALTPALSPRRGGTESLTSVVPGATNQNPVSGPLSTLEVAQAVMVTV